MHQNIQKLKSYLINVYVNYQKRFWLSLVMTHATEMTKKEKFSAKLVDSAGRVGIFFAGIDAEPKTQETL